MPLQTKISQTEYQDIISDKVPDYSNDPYFVNKAKEAVKFLEKHPFPKELLTKTKTK